MEQKNLKKFLVFKIIAFEPGSTNSDVHEQVTCHWQSICYQATLRVNVSLKEIFCKAAFLRVIKKQDESTFKKILEECGTL